MSLCSPLPLNKCLTLQPPSDHTRNNKPPERFLLALFPGLRNIYYVKDVTWTGAQILEEEFI